MDGSFYLGLITGLGILALWLAAQSILISYFKININLILSILILIIFGSTIYPFLGHVKNWDYGFYFGFIISLVFVIRYHLLVINAY